MLEEQKDAPTCLVTSYSGIRDLPGEAMRQDEIRAVTAATSSACMAGHKTCMCMQGMIGVMCKRSVAAELPGASRWSNHQPHRS